MFCFKLSSRLPGQNTRLAFEMMQDFLFRGRTTFSRLSVVPAAIGYTDIVSYLATSSKFPVETEYWYRAQDSGENQEKSSKGVVYHYIFNTGHNILIIMQMQVDSDNSYIIWLHHLLLNSIQLKSHIYYQ